MTMRKRRVLFAALCIVCIPALLAVGLVFGSPEAQPVSAVKLTEIMNNNVSWYADNNGTYYDWVEITNTGNTAVDISDLTLSDDPAEPTAFSFGDRMLAPMESLVVFLTGNADEHRRNHATFGLGSRGDTVYLYHGERELDRISVGESPENVSFGVADGHYVWFATPTPAAKNSGITAKTVQELETACYTDVLINEVCAVSRKTDTTHPYDWVELVNTSDRPISLNGYRLTESFTEQGLVFEDVTLDAGEYLVVPCSEDDLENTLCAPFSLNPYGETLLLITPDNVVCDRFESGKQRRGITSGRQNGDRSTRSYFTSPTPAAANGDGKAGYAPMPTANRIGGYTAAGQTVTLTVPNGCRVYYTTDGSVPTESDTTYTAGEVLTIQRTTVLRAVCYRADCLPSDVLTQTYLAEEAHDIPVVSVSGDPQALFGADGAFTDYLDESHEVAVHTEYFTENGIKAVTFDSLLRIAGGLSRYNVQKAFSLNLNQTVGETSVTYPFFKDAATDTFRNLLLRPSGSDWSSAKLRDEFVAAALDGEKDLVIQAVRPVALYINGKYHGLYYLREKRNEAFVAAETGVAEENVEIAKSPALYEINTKLHPDMAELIAYARKHDLTEEEHYRYVTDRINETSLMRYYAIQTWFGNGDVINNTAYYRDITDGEWNWLIFDMDWACTAYYANYNFLEQLYKGTGVHTYRNYYDPLMTALLQNQDFRREFIAQYKELMNTLLSPERLLPILDECAAAIETEIPRQYKQYGAPSITKWTTQIEYMRTFIQGREAVITRQLTDVFDLSEAG